MKKHLEKIVWALTFILIIVSIFVQMSGWLVTLPLTLYYLVPLFILLIVQVLNYIMDIFIRWLDGLSNLFKRKV